MKSGNLNFLEPSRPLQACNGTALPLLLSFTSLRLSISFIKIHDWSWQVNIGLIIVFWTPSIDDCVIRILFSRRPFAWLYSPPAITFAFVLAVVTEQQRNTYSSLAQTDFTDDKFVSPAERFHRLPQHRSTKILTGREIKL